MAGRWEVTRISGSMGERGEKGVRIVHEVHEEVDIRQVLSAGGWGNERHMSSIFL